MTVKIQDGATYTIVKRSRPDSGQRLYYRLGDNGQELELTDEEAATSSKLFSIRSEEPETRVRSSAPVSCSTCNAQQ